MRWTPRGVWCLGATLRSPRSGRAFKGLRARLRVPRRWGPHFPGSTLVGGTRARCLAKWASEGQAWVAFPVGGMRAALSAQVPIVGGVTAPWDLASPAAGPRPSGCVLSGGCPEAPRDCRWHRAPGPRIWASAGCHRPGCSVSEPVPERAVRTHRLWPEERQSAGVFASTKGSGWGTGWKGVLGSQTKTHAASELGGPGSA